MRTPWANRRRPSVRALRRSHRPAHVDYLVRCTRWHEDHVTWAELRLKNLERGAVDLREPLEGGVVEGVREQRAEAVVASGGLGGVLPE